jgi:hypothetical protein
MELRDELANAEPDEKWIEFESNNPGTLLH